MVIDGEVRPLGDVLPPAVGVAGDQAYVAMGGPRPGLFVSDVIEALPLGG